MVSEERWGVFTRGNQPVLTGGESQPHMLSIFGDALLFRLFRGRNRTTRVFRTNADAE